MVFMISHILCHKVVIIKMYILYIGWILLSAQQHQAIQFDSVAQSK